MSEQERTGSDRAIQNLHHAITVVVDTMVDARVQPLEAKIAELEREVATLKATGPDWRGKPRSRLAEWMGVSPGKIDQWVRSGHLHPVRVAGMTWPLFLREDVEHLLASGESNNG